MLLLKALQNTKNSIKYYYHWEKEAISLTGVFSGKAIDFTNEPSMWRSFVKNYFVDDGDTQLVTNRFDMNTYCAVSRGNFVYSFSFLRT